MKSRVSMVVGLVLLVVAFALCLTGCVGESSTPTKPDTSKQPKPTTGYIDKDSILAIYAGKPYAFTTANLNYGYISIWTGKMQWYMDIKWYTRCGGGIDTTWGQTWHTQPIGDIDGSDGVDVADLTKLIAYLNCETVSNMFSIRCADFNQDGYVEIEDLNKLIDFLYITGWPAYPNELNTGWPPAYQGCDPATEPLIPDTTKYGPTYGC